MRSVVALGLSLVTGTLSALGSVTLAQAQTLDALNRVAYRAELSEEFAIAEDMYRQILTLDATDIYAYIYLGNVLLDQERWEEAEATFEAGIQLLPADELRSPEALYLGLGNAHLGQAQFAAAEAAFQTAISLNDQAPFGYRALGRLLRDRREFAAAEAAFNAIVQQEPAAPHGSEAYWDLGKTLVAQDRLEEAELAYRRAIGLDSEAVEYWQSLSVVVRLQGNTSELASIAGEIRRINTETADLTEALSQQPLRQRYGSERYQTQLAETQSLLQRHPDVVAAYIEQGNALRRLGRFAEAEAAFRQATRLNPDNPLAHYSLSETLTDLGDDEAASAAYQVALQLYPEISPPGSFLETNVDASSLFQLSSPLYVQADTPEQPASLARTANAAAAARNGRRLPSRVTPRRSAPLPQLRRPFSSSDAGLDDLLSQIRLNPDDAILQGQLGYRYYIQDDLSEAVAAFQVMAQLDPRQAFLAHHNLGVIFYRQEQFDAAESSFRRAIAHIDEIGGDTNAAEYIAETYRTFGNLLADRGDWAKAVELYQDAIQRDLASPSLYQDSFWQTRLQGALAALARSSLAQGQYDVAETAYRTLIRDYSENYFSYQFVDELATLLFNQGELQAAEAVYVNAITARPEQLRPLYRGLETVLRAQDRISDADGLVAIAEASAPPSLRRRPVPEARRLSPLSRALAVPAFPAISPLAVAYDAFGHKRLAQGQYFLASFSFEQAANIGRSYVDALIAQGLALTYQGNQGAAEAAYQRAISIQPEALQCYVLPPDIGNQAWQPEDYHQTGEACLSVLLAD